MWFLLSCLTLRAICPAINTGLSSTRKAGIRSSQFSFVPVNKPVFFNFSLWMQPPITSTTVNWTCSGTIISIRYYTDQSIPGYVKFFMINVSSFQHGYYNCINILCFLLTLLHKSIVCSVISFFISIQVLKYTEINCQTTDSFFFLLAISLAFQAFSYVSHLGSCFTFFWSFEELDCTSASWFLPSLNAIFSTAHLSRCTGILHWDIKKGMCCSSLWLHQALPTLLSSFLLLHSILFLLYCTFPPYLKKHYLYFPPQEQRKFF